MIPRAPRSPALCPHRCRTMSVLVPFAVVALLTLLAGRVLLGRLRATITKVTVQRTLYLREVKSPVQKLQETGGLGNPFCAEFLLVVDDLAHVLDLAVMKYVDSDVPMLALQERQHSKLHRMCEDANAAKNGGDRWAWLRRIAELLLLRNRTLGVSLAGHLEAGAWVWFALPLTLPFCKGFASNLFLFHGMEEMEHGALTLNSLQRQSGPLLAVATLPFVVAGYFVFFLAPPIVRAVAEPSLLALPSTYGHLANYYATFLPTYIMTVWISLPRWILRWSEDQGEYEARVNLFKELLSERKFEFRIVDEATYELEV